MLAGMMRRGIYAGSFDPPTKGHLWMIRQGAALFDELIVAPALNPDKKGFLTHEQRLNALREMTADLPNVRVQAVESGFLVDFAKAAGAQFLLRGIRNAADCDYERTMAHMNARMEPQITTVFLMPPSELADISSSLVRGFVGVAGSERWLSACVPPCVLRLLTEDFHTT